MTLTFNKDMKKNERLQALRDKVPLDVKLAIEYSYRTAKQIAIILKKQNKTRSDLARALGKSESEVSKWMSGAHNFTYKTIAKIEAALGERIMVGGSSTQQFIFKGTFNSSEFLLVVEGKNAGLKHVTNGSFQINDKVFDTDDLCHMHN